MRHRPRVFIGYHEIAGYCSSLEAAFRTEHIKVHFCELIPHKFYEISSGTRVERFFRKHFFSSPWKFRFGVRLWRFKNNVLKFLLFMEMILRYDAFIFVDRYSPLGLKERRRLRFLGKRVVSVFLGSDSRPLYENGAFWERFGDDYANMEAAVREQCDDVTAIERGSDVVICHTLTAHFLMRPFVRFLAIGFPFNTDRLAGHETGQQKKTGRRIRILHAPSSPKFKGTPAIVSAIDELRDEGLDLELVLLTGRPNSEVLEEIARCDFIVDELYSDTPLAGLAVEGAAMGKPSVVGAYAAASDFTEQKIPPSALTNPIELKAMIRSMVLDANKREALGFAAKDYINNEWSSSEVARRFLRLIDGTADKAWFSDPSLTNYVYGWGIEAVDLRERLKKYIFSRGIDGLCLEDKPALENAFICFTNSA